MPTANRPNLRIVYLLGLSQVFELLGQPAGGGTIRLSPWRVAELAASGLLEAPTAHNPDLPDMETLRGHMEGGLRLSPMPAPAGLRAELRQYQEEGLA